MIWWKSLKCSKKLLRDGLVLGRIGEAKSDGGGFSNGENTWTQSSLTSVWSICFFSVILICLRFHSQITDVRFHHFRRLRWVHLLSLGGVVFVIFVYNGQYCFFLLLLLISTRSSTDLLDIGLSAKMHNLPYQSIWILFNHHDLKLCKRELSVLVLVGELEHLIDVGLSHRHR